MGSDQSSQQGHSKGRSKNPKRSQSNDGSGRSGANAAETSQRAPARSSPRPSICSDSDIPYASYVRTYSVPEELPDRKVRWSDPKPRAREKHISREKRDNKSKSVGSLVVVKAAAEIPKVETDPLFTRLKEIPPFVPIIRGSLRIPWTKDSEISDKIDSNPLIRIGLFYEERLTRHAKIIEREQLVLIGRIHDLDHKLKAMMKAYGDRQRRFGKYAERLGHITDLSNSLTKCHQTLNSTLESIEVLNNLLPAEERLEAFVWTTG